MDGSRNRSHKVSAEVKSFSVGEVLVVLATAQAGKIIRFCASALCRVGVWRLTAIGANIGKLACIWKWVISNALRGASSARPVMFDILSFSPQL